MRNVSIRMTAGHVPRIPFEQIARRILGDGYDLSVVVCGDRLSRRLNRTYRKKEYAANVLSFPLGRHEGEIFLNVRKAEREARAMGLAPHRRVLHLFIHGLLHLKGLPHGRTMDRTEEKLLRAF